MKNTVKKLVAVILTVLICLSLCSCSMLDQMKEEQAFYLTDDRTEIIWKGVTYKYIPIKDEILGEYGPGGSITTSDVPVLLSGMLGNSFGVVEPHGLIYGNGMYYCKEDEYDYYMTFLANYNKDKYAYRTEEIIGTNAYRSHLNIVDVDTVKAIEEILAFHKVEDFNYRTSWLFSIYTCEDTGTFYDYCFEVVEVKGEAGSYYFQYDNKINGEEYYKVPEQYKPLFDKIYDDIQTKDKFW